MVPSVLAPKERHDTFLRRSFPCRGGNQISGHLAIQIIQLSEPQKDYRFFPRKSYAPELNKDFFSVDLGNIDNGETFRVVLDNHNVIGS